MRVEGGIVIEWSPVASPVTIIALVGALVGFGGWLFRLGSRNREIDAMREDMADLKKRRGEEREADRKEREAFQVSVNAGIDMIRGTHAEFQKTCAERFATKVELGALEDRTNKGMDRIVDRLEQISGRLETIGDAIIKTLASQERR